jgi:hypothetical protein
LCEQGKSVKVKLRVLMRSARRVIVATGSQKIASRYVA